MDEVRTCKACGKPIKKGQAYLPIRQGPEAGDCYHYYGSDCSRDEADPAEATEDTNGSN